MEAMLTRDCTCDDQFKLDVNRFSGGDGGLGLYALAEVAIGKQHT